MKKVLVFLAAALLQAGAWAVTYTYTGVPYTPSVITNYTNCAAGACDNFTPAMSQTGSFTTATTLPPDLANADIAPLITSFSFSDGLTQYNGADPDTTLVGATAFTDASGGVLAIALSFQHWSTSIHAFGSRMDVMVLHLLARKNSQCQGAIFQSPNGRDVCQTVDFDAASSRVTFASPVTPGSWDVTSLPPAVAKAVPTLGEWSLLLLAALMGGAGWWQVRRRGSVLA